MSPIFGRDNENDLSDEDLAWSFVSDGLTAFTTAGPAIKAAAAAGSPVTWRPGRARGPDAAHLADVIQQAVADTRAIAQFPGLRLVAPVGRSRFTGGLAQAVHGIVGQPGYQAAGRLNGADSGLASLVIDTTMIGTLRRPAALTWPLTITGTDDVIGQLAKSSAVTTGFADIVPHDAMTAAATRGPHILAEVVDFNEQDFHGQSLALRFLRRGANPRPLDDTMSFNALSGLEPTVFLPLDGTDAATELAQFTDALAHDLPVDVAAWVASRWRSTTGSPLVAAPRAFLGTARLSATIPALQARLRGFSPDTILPLDIDDLRKFGPAFTRNFDAGGPLSTGRIVDFLDDAKTFTWDRGTDTAGGLLAIIRGADALDNRTGGVPVQLPSAPAPPIPRPDAPSLPPLLPHDSAPDQRQRPQAQVGPPEVQPDRTGDRFRKFAAGRPRFDQAIRPHIGLEPDSAEPGPEAVPQTDAPVDSAPSAPPPPPPSETEDTAAASGEPPPPRYTDITLKGPDDRELTTADALVNARSYSLDVAVRAKRTGLTQDRADQAPVAIPRQTETEKVWVVITDENDGPPAFVIAHRFDSLWLPVSGDSEDSARFTITPKLVLPADGTGRGSIGIRLYHRLVLLDHVQLDIQIVSGPDVTSPQPAIGVTFKHPGNSSVGAFDAAAETRRLTIAIDRPAAGLYRFAIVTGERGSDKPDLFATRTLPETVLNDFVTQFRGILLDAVFGPSLVSGQMKSDERDTLVKALSLLGIKMFNALFDVLKGKGDMAALGDMLRTSRLPEGSIVQIALTEEAKDFVFPWQILTFSSDAAPDTPANLADLWGWRHIIEVRRCGEGGDPRAVNARRKQPVTVRYGRWKFPNEPEHAQHLREIVLKACVPSVLVQPIVEKREEFITALRDAADVLYVYAHGHTAAPMTPSQMTLRDCVEGQINELQKRKTKNEAIGLDTSEIDRSIDVLNVYLETIRPVAGPLDSMLTLTTQTISLAELIANRLPPRDELITFRDAPIVFLNTCQSAQAWNAIEDSFVGFFLARGACAVLGTETTIPVVAAEAFGRTVLAQMFAGKSLGEAAHLARIGLLETHQNPIGLAYTIYGAADARIVPPPQVTSKVTSQAASQDASNRRLQ